MGSSVLGTVLAGGVVLLCVIQIIRKMIKDKKSGKSISCGGDCSKCHTCAWTGCTSSDCKDQFMFGEKGGK